jgi:hypothetical protein
MCVLNLKNPYFSHEHMWPVPLRKTFDLFVYITEGKTKNIVYPNAQQ